jgi:hypothetical protein
MCSHIDALDWMSRQLAGKPAGTGIMDVFNFGTGKGTTVRCRCPRSGSSGRDVYSSLHAGV